MVARPPSVCDLRITLSTLPAAGRLPASADATASPQTGTLPLTSTASEPIGDSSKSRKSMAPWQFGLRRVTLAVCAENRRNKRRERREAREIDFEAVVLDRAGRGGERERRRGVMAEAERRRCPEKVARPAEIAANETAGGFLGNS
ncbi:hypothetical protein KM043_002922 [Ampulex compressa]|nr:hypothetical protein KM043_002922 [Ampulex compressa]